MALNLTTLHAPSSPSISAPQKISVLASAPSGCQLNGKPSIRASLCYLNQPYPISLVHIATFSKSTRTVEESSHPPRFRVSQSASSTLYPAELASGGDGGDDDANGSGGGGNGGPGGDGHEGAGGSDSEKNRIEAILALASLGKDLSNVPADLASAIQDGRIPGAIVTRFFELQTNPFFRWLLQFGGFKERLLADELFLTKVAIECGVGIFTKTAAELERRRENFSKELDFVFADVVSFVLCKVYTEIFSWKVFNEFCHHVAQNTGWCTDLICKFATCEMNRLYDSNMTTVGATSLDLLYVTN
ncbi:hypothetical protein L7F22_041071 [Adiantum nelumboides]|nr:hypothetical protein [Adiantum nelumboides]